MKQSLEDKGVCAYVCACVCLCVCVTACWCLHVYLVWWGFNSFSKKHLAQVLRWTVGCVVWAEVKPGMGNSINPHFTPPWTLFSNISRSSQLYFATWTAVERRHLRSIFIREDRLHWIQPVHKQLNGGLEDKNHTLNIQNWNDLSLFLFRKNWSAIHNKLLLERQI